VSAMNCIGTILKRFLGIACSHYWQPLNDSFHGSHSHWDVAFNVKRKWKCIHCGKQTLSANPISFINQNRNKAKEAKL
jgi:hypothetical protein